MPRINTQVFNENNDKNRIKSNNNKICDDIEYTRLLETKEYNAGFSPNNDSQDILIKKQDNILKLKPTLNFDDSDQLISIVPTKNYENLRLKEIEIDKKNTVDYQLKKEIIDQDLTDDNHLSISQKSNGFCFKN